MKQISSMDLYFLVQELKVLENQRIDNFYYENDTFYLKVYVSGDGNKFLTNKRSKFIYLSNEKAETSVATSFVKFLRKTLKNGYVRKVKQIEGERILEIEIEKKINEEIVKFYLILELFANGNIIICDSKMIVREAASKRKFKDRKVMVRDKYELPPARDLIVTSLDEKIFTNALRNSDLSVVKFLAIKLGIGGKFAEEVCGISGIDKNINSCDVDSRVVIKSLKKVVSMKINAKLLMKDSKMFDFVPFEFVSVSYDTVSEKSFNDCLKKYYSQFLIIEDKREKMLAKELTKLQNRLEKQEEQLKKVEKDYEKYNALGNVVYENYSTIEELLNSINQTAKKKGWDYVLKTIEEKPELKKIIKKLNYKNNEIILNL